MKYYWNESSLDGMSESQNEYGIKVFHILDVDLL